MSDESTVWPKSTLQKWRQRWIFRISSSAGWHSQKSTLYWISYVQWCESLSKVKSVLNALCPMHCGVATISTILQIICLFCGISSLVYGSSATETYNFKEHINRSHPMCPMHCVQVCVLCPITTNGTLSVLKPPKKLPGCGFPTPCTLFCLIYTINSELAYFPISPIWVSRGRFPLVFSGRVR